MSDPTGKLDWFDTGKSIGIGLITMVVGVLVRLLFGRAVKDLDDKLGELPKLRDAVNDLRVEVAELKAKVDGFDDAPPPQPTPKVGP